MRESVRILRFILVGALNALIMAVTVWIMMELLHINYLISNITAHVLAQINNFLWSKYWVFPKEEQGRVWREIVLFILVFALAYGAQALLLVLMVEQLGWNEYLSQFLGLFVYGAVNFILNKKVTFRPT